MRAYLSERVPSYMVPAAYVELEGLPLTPNGKVDRRGLPGPEGRAYATPGYEAPVGGVEEALAAIWAEVLGVERVGRQDDFFALGGHSLLAVTLIEQIRQTLGVEIAAEELFERPVLTELARVVASAERAVALPPIESVARSATGEAGPAAPALAHLRRSGCGFWSSWGGWERRITSRGGVAAARRVGRGGRCGGRWDRIVARHEAWRTTPVAVDGVPRQVILPAAARSVRADGA